MLARVRSDVPWAVTITVVVLTSATSCATAMPFRFEGAQDGGVVDEVAENRERPGVGVLEGERDGIPDAEAHAEVSRSDDTQRLRCQSAGSSGCVGLLVRMPGCHPCPPSRVWPAIADALRKDRLRDPAASSRRR